MINKTTARELIIEQVFQHLHHLTVGQYPETKSFQDLTLEVIDLIYDSIADEIDCEEKSLGKLKKFIDSVGMGGSTDYETWNEGYNEHVQLSKDFKERLLK